MRLPTVMRALYANESKSINSIRFYAHIPFPVARLTPPCALAWPLLLCLPSYRLTHFGDNRLLPLERSVQILKRRRDVYFYEQDDQATASIILTTLAAEAYQGELSIFETIDRIITYIEQKPRNSFGRIEPFRACWGILTVDFKGLTRLELPLVQ